VGREGKAATQPREKKVLICAAKSSKEGCFPDRNQANRRHKQDKNEYGEGLITTQRKGLPIEKSLGS